VWQMVIASGRLTAPVDGVAVIAAPAPTLTVATAKALAPLLPGRRRMPSLLLVAESATMSATGVLEVESNSVLTPSEIGAAGTPATTGVAEQSKPRMTVSGAKAAIGVKATTKLCDPPARIVAGVFDEPVGTL